MAFTQSVNFSGTLASTTTLTNSSQTSGQLQGHKVSKQKEALSQVPQDASVSSITAQIAKASLSPCAPRREKNAKVQHQAGLAVLEGCTFRGNERVLDVGCGTGKTTAAVAARVPYGEVVGLGVSADVIQEAKKNYGTIRNLSFVHQDATDLHFDKKFDVILSFFAVHWMKDPEAAFRKFHDALRPGGRIILRMSGGPQPEFREVFNSKPWVSRVKKTWQEKTTPEYAELLEKAGFQNMDARTEWRTSTFESKKDFLKYLMAWMPHCSGLPQAEAEQLSRAIIDRIMQDQSNTNGPIKLQWPWTFIQARTTGSKL